MLNVSMLFKCYLSFLIQRLIRESDANFKESLIRKSVALNLSQIKLRISRGCSREKKFMFLTEASDIDL